MKLRFICFSVLTFLIIIKSSAQPNGCLVNGFGVYYQNPLSSDPTTFFQGNSYFVSQAQCNLSPSRTYYSLVSTTTTPCSANYQSGPTNQSSSYARQGVKVVFNRLNCPLDDYIHWLILPISIFGFYYMSKRSLLI